jgi:hypothetical protein
MFPDVSDAFWGFTEPMTFRVITREVVDYESESSSLISRIIDGVLEPQTPQKVALKPEGVRNWKWWSLWTTAVLANLDEIVDADGRKFQVQSQSDWRRGNYVEYEVTEMPS